MGKANWGKSVQNVDVDKNTSTGKGKGSRFDILNEEVELLAAEVDGIAISKVTVDKPQRDKKVLIEITNQKKGEFPSLNPKEKQGSASFSKDNVGSKGRKYVHKPIVQVRNSTEIDSIAASECEVQSIEKNSLGDADGCRPALPNISDFNEITNISKKRGSRDT
ncbi:hypothetical protein QYF36_023208 [Acer negundo]|nr:hypothetical protein QYF36_023208 [Acer negundo]